ncbi:MAG: glutathione S-transferase family protein [Acidisphaera sp.]|nr:glutathione S-transferase family protein [Acidisphaera sp.]
MLRLWGRDNSSNVMKVIWLLEELRLPYERLDVGGPFGKTDTPEYRAMNPTGLVPTLDDDGFTMWESNAILRYLCEAHAPETPLWPKQPQARGKIDQWMDYQQCGMNRPQGVVFLGLIRTPPEKRDMAAIAKGAEEAGRSWAIVDAALGRHPFVAGEAFSLADIVFGVHAHRWLQFPVARPDTPHLKAWYERLLTRPIYAKHIARPLT